MFFSALPCALLLFACTEQVDQKVPSPAVGAQSPTKADGKAPAIDTLTADKLDAVATAKIELGKWLFFDPRLSGSGKTSCSTCHLPDRAWTDGERFSKKDDGSMNTRNAPTMYGVGQLEKLYWDGRAPSLEKNVLAAWKGQMGGKPEAVAQALAAVPAYAAQFTQAKIDGPSESGIVDGLAAFLRSLRGGNSKFDQWRAGKQDAVSVAARAGYSLFMGKAGCSTCHQEPLFTDRVFHNAGVGMDQQKPDPGAGGEKALNDPKLVGWFKTPTLRDVAVTAPYFHDGSAATLEEAVRFMQKGGRDNPTKSPEMIDRKLTDEEVAQLVEFLHTLTSDEHMTPPKLPD